MTTSDRELYRLLDLWFTDGPDEAPDRLLEGVVDRIARERQRPGWRIGRWTWPAVPTAVRLGAIAAALLAILAVGVFVGGGGPAPLPVPSPTASPTPSPTPAPSPQTLVAPMSSLAPGTYAYTTNGGGTTFTVPEGWRVPTFGPLDFSLSPVGAATDDTVRVFYDMRVAAQNDACSESPEPGVGSTAAEIFAALGAIPDLERSTPAPITIGGLDGLLMDVSLAPTATRECPFSEGAPTVPLVVDTIPSEGPFWGVARGNRQRIVVLDRPTSNNVVLLIESADGTTFDALVEAAMPVLQTFTFE